MEKARRYRETQENEGIRPTAAPRRAPEVIPPRVPNEPQSRGQKRARDRGNDKSDKRKRPSEGKTNGGQAATGGNAHGSTPLCSGCGRGGHTKQTCRLLDHPDWNPTNLAWAVSRNGKKWAERNGADGTPFYRLPFKQTLSGKPFHGPDPGSPHNGGDSRSPHNGGGGSSGNDAGSNGRGPPSGKKDGKSEWCQECVSAHGVESPDEGLTSGSCCFGLSARLASLHPTLVKRIVDYRLEDTSAPRRVIYNDASMGATLCVDNMINTKRTADVNVAIDSQSVFSNFVNRRVMGLLGAAARRGPFKQPDQVKVRNVSGAQSLVCSGFKDDCRPVDGEVELVLGVFDNHERQVMFYRIRAFVIDSDQDVTIGLGALMTCPDMMRFLVDNVHLAARGPEPRQANSTAELCEPLTQPGANDAKTIVPAVGVVTRENSRRGREGIAARGKKAKMEARARLSRFTLENGGMTPESMRGSRDVRESKALCLHRKDCTVVHEPVYNEKGEIDYVQEWPLSSGPVTPSTPLFIGSREASNNAGALTTSFQPPFHRTVPNVSCFHMLRNFEEEGDDVEGDEDLQDTFPRIAAADAKGELPTKFSGDEKLVEAQRKICEKYRSVFSRDLRPEPARITPMVLDIDGAWERSENRRPPRIQGEIKTTEISNQVREMVEKKVVNVSSAAYYSQVLLVKKPDGTFRFCVDFRRLNLLTTSSAWPIPNIKHMIDRLGSLGANYFAVLDLTKGYYQAPLSVNSRKFTAFVTPFGTYEWTRVPMGLKGAPSYFQQMMCTEVLNGLILRCCEVYMDDIIIYGKTREQYLSNLTEVLSALQRRNVTANPVKCRLGLSEVEYVGHTINAKGKTFTRAKLQEVVDFPTPILETELRQFLGLANYFRDHIKDHSLVVYPLQILLGDGSTKRKKLVWTDDASAALVKIKQLVNDCPLLFFQDPSLPVHLYTDASDIGWGGYLCQRDVDGKDIPIGFVSKTFTKLQKRWSVPEREAFGVLESVRKFAYTLQDVKFVLHTDHLNLIYIRDTGSPKVIRWKMELQEYNFDLVHVAGKDNVVADFMSRNTAASEDSFVPEPETVCNFFAHAHDQDEKEDEPVIVGFNKARRTTAAITSLPDDAFNKITAVHNAVSGHHGVERTLLKLQAAGQTWPYMKLHVAYFIENCDCCQKMDTRGREIHSRPYTTGGHHPFERVNMDTIGPYEEDSNGYKYCLVIVDTFSRFMRVYPMKDTTAESSSRALLIHCGTFGTPAEVMTDGGPENANATIDALCLLMGVPHITTLAHSHQENAIVERTNKEIVRWLRDLLYSSRKLKSEWSTFIPFAERIHNATVVSTTGYSPAEIIFGAAAKLDAGIFLPRTKTMDEAVDAWMEKRLAQQAAVIASAQANQLAHNAEHMGSKPHELTEFKVGDYVLLAWPVTRMAPNGRPTKLDALYRGPYQVVSSHLDRYQIRNLVTNTLEPDKSVHSLKLFKFDASRTNPRDIALKDFKDMYLVEKVLAHRGKADRRSNMSFLVKWLGYDKPEDNTWEPFANIRDNEILHEYLRSKKLKRFIPIKISNR